MTGKIRTELEKDTLSPVVVVFLQLILQIAGLLEREQEPAEPAHEAGEQTFSGFLEGFTEGALDMSRAGSQQAWAAPPAPVFWEHVNIRMPSLPITEMSQDFPLYGPPSPLSIGLYTDGIAMTINLPDGVTEFDLDTRGLRVKWQYPDGRKSEFEDLRPYMTSLDVSYFPGALAMCTPGRDMLTSDRAIIELMSA